ncbi:MAG: OmpA family protein [Bacteroidota bacterium]
MSAIDKFKEAATILQEADVSDIISSLAIGIATAQKQLDENSIKQTLALADSSKNIQGRSLLELGFSPAFYHFQYADVHASVNLKMRLNTSFSLGIGLDVDFSSQGGISRANRQFLEETQDSEHRDEFRSSRQFLMDANEERPLNVLNTPVQMNQQEGSVSKVENYAQRLRQTPQVDGVRTEIKSDKLAVDQGSDPEVVVSNANGYVTVKMPHTETSGPWGIVQIGDYPQPPGKTINLDAGLSTGTFQIRRDFDTTWAAATKRNGRIAPTDGEVGLVLGFSASGVYTEVDGPLETLAVRFAPDQDTLDFGYDTNPKYATAFQMLAEILRLDSTARVLITGHTDSTVQEAYSQFLAKGRSQKLAQYFVKRGAHPGQIVLNQQGSKEAIAEVGENQPVARYRKATVALTSSRDYLAFIGGLMTLKTTPYQISPQGSGWLHKQDGGQKTGTGAARFSIDQNDYVLEAQEHDPEALKTSFEAIPALADHYDFELVDGVAHLLPHDATIKHIVYSQATEEIPIENPVPPGAGADQQPDPPGPGDGGQDNNPDQGGDGGTPNNEDDQNSIRIDDNQNDNTRLLREGNQLENPRTLAVGASVDFRTSRQFEISAEGSSSVAARLVSLPAPPEFLEVIKNFLE